MEILSPHRGMLGLGLYEIFGSFAPNGSGTIDNTLSRTGKGVGTKCGFTATYAASTGLYNVDLAEGVTELVSLSCWLTKGGGAQVESNTDYGALANQGRRLQFATYNGGGTLADLAAASGRRINFRAVCRLFKQ